MKQIIFLLFLVSSLWACVNTSEEKKTLSYEYRKSIIYASTNSNDTLGEISYPLFNNNNLNKYLNKSIFYFYIPDEEKAELVNLDSISAERIASYDSFYHERYFPPENWKLLMDIKIKINKQNYISIAYNHIDFINNNPSDSLTRYINYNLKNNTPISIDSVVKGGYNGLSKVCEKIFRRKYGISPTSSLKDYFHYEEFQMPYDFYLDDKSIIFEYKPYKIKHKKGVDKTLIVPYDSLRSILKSNLIEELL